MKNNPPTKKVRVSLPTPDTVNQNTKSRDIRASLTKSSSATSACPHVSSTRRKKSTTVTWRRQCSRSTKSDKCSNRRKSHCIKKLHLGGEVHMEVVNRWRVRNIGVVRTDRAILTVLRIKIRPTIDSWRGQLLTRTLHSSSRGSTIDRLTTRWILTVKMGTIMERISCHRGQEWYFKAKPSSWTAMDDDQRDAWATVVTLQKVTRCGTNWVASFHSAALRRVTTIITSSDEEWVRDSLKLVHFMMLKESC